MTTGVMAPYEKAGALLKQHISTVNNQSQVTLAPGTDVSSGQVIVIRKIVAGYNGAVATFGALTMDYGGTPDTLFTAYVGGQLGPMDFDFPFGLCPRYISENVVITLGAVTGNIAYLDVFFV